MPRMVFLNPWDHLIGPNRYLLEMLRQSPELASQAVVVFHESNNALEEYRDLGCAVHIWPEIALIHPVFTLRNMTQMFWRHTAGVVKLTRSLRNLNPSLVVSNTENLWVGAITARLVGVAHIQIVHSLIFKYRWSHRARLVRLYVKGLSCFTRQFVAVSQAVKQMLLDQGVKDAKISVVPNGFDLDDIKEKSELPLPQEIKRLISGRHPILVCIGRIAPMKGQNVLIEALGKIKHLYPNLTCLLAGRDNTGGIENVAQFRMRLTNLIEQHKLEDSVHFLGEIDYVPALLQCADVYVHPSRTESFSRVVAEAIICGKPVVCSNLEALRQAVGSQGAIFVPASDADALAQGIVKILSDEPLRRSLKLSGQNHVKSNFQSTMTAKLFCSCIVSNL